MEDLIQHAHTIFDERLFWSPPVPSFDVAETMSSGPYSSPLFLSPEMQFDPFHDAGDIPRHQRPVVEDLNSSPLFLSPEFPQFDAFQDAGSTPRHQHHSSMLWSPELPQFAAVQASTPRHRPELVGGISVSPRSSLSSFPSDGSVDSIPTPRGTLLTPLLLSS